MQATYLHKNIPPSNVHGLLCVPVQASGTEAALTKIKRAAVFADLVELRLDLIGRPRVEELIGASTVPVIATFRSRGQGGAGTDGAAADMLLRARDAGAAYVDVEFGLPRDVRRSLLREAGLHRAILSCHMIERTPPVNTLIRLMDRMCEEGPAMVKIVSRACFQEDSLSVLSLIPLARARGVGVSAFCMGRKGMLSRVLSLYMGAALGFAALDEQDRTADGQIPVRMMRLMLQQKGPMP
jgi:3-dehydroquinate dehydratase type I